MSKCYCRPFDINKFENCIGMSPPKGLAIKTVTGKLKKNIPIDCCIAGDIAYLWMNGIYTLGSCCGHYKKQPSVIVHPDYAEKMRGLGYTETIEVPSGLHCFVLLATPPIKGKD